MKYDVVIIGAGIVGSLIADKLAKYDLAVAVLEKRADSGLEQSMSSSAIVHSGIDPKDGTLKAKYNVLGNRMMEGLCGELDVDYLKCGGYICACNDQELEHLNKMRDMADQRGIECKIINGEQLRQVEPNVSLEIKYALSMPTTAVIYPTELTIAAIERSITNGTDVYYEHQVTEIKYTDEGYQITANDKVFDCNYIVNCAGIYSDQIAKLTDPLLEVKNIPKRGEYFVTNNIKPIVRSVIYPVPNENGKGVLAVPTTHGNVLLGPNGVIQESRSDDSTHSSDLKYVEQNVSKILTHFPSDIIKTYAGLRSSGNAGDFYIDRCRVTHKMFNLIAIDSPGLASSPAIAQDICEQLVSELELTDKVNYNPVRSRYLSLKEYDLDEQNRLISEDANLGKIICRCEQVTEGEIRAAIRKTNGARDLTGIKFRIRPMLGMCQGGFCETEVVRILADELNVPFSAIKRSGADSVIVKGGIDEL